MAKINIEAVRRYKPLAPINWDPVPDVHTDHLPFSTDPAIREVEINFLRRLLDEAQSYQAR